MYKFIFCTEWVFSTYTVVSCHKFRSYKSGYLANLCSPESQFYCMYMHGFGESSYYGMYLRAIYVCMYICLYIHNYCSYNKKYDQACKKHIYGGICKICQIRHVTVTCLVFSLLMSAVSVCICSTPNASNNCVLTWNEATYIYVALSHLRSKAQTVVHNWCILGSSGT